MSMVITSWLDSKDQTRLCQSCITAGKHCSFLPGGSDVHLQWIAVILWPPLAAPCTQDPLIRSAKGLHGLWLFCHWLRRDWSHILVNRKWQTSFGLHGLHFFFLSALHVWTFLFFISMTHFKCPWKVKWPRSCLKHLYSVWSVGHLRLEVSGLFNI